MKGRNDESEGFVPDQPALNTPTRTPGGGRVIRERKDFRTDEEVVEGMNQDFLNEEFDPLRYTLELTEGQSMMDLEEFREKR
jgi:hypothetical protein